MPNKGKRSYSRKRRKYNLKQVRATPAIVLGTLASAVAVKADVIGTTDMAHRCISLDMVWSCPGLTAGEGPIAVGYADDDYTVTEIKECLEAGNLGFTDKIAAERQRRLVRIVGHLSNEIPTLNDGRPIKTRLNWLIPTGHAVAFFAYNEGSAPLSTGAILKTTGNMFVTKGT